jgi:hypothetical protein
MLSKFLPFSYFSLPLSHCKSCCKYLQQHFVNNKRSFGGSLVCIGSILGVVSWCSFKVILLHSTFVFLAFISLTWRPKQSILLGKNW